MRIYNMNSSIVERPFIATLRLFSIIPALTCKFFKLTAGISTHRKISTDPRFFPFFENCIGAIDGTHVPITISQEKQAPYRNRKGTLSQNVMLACDFDLNFTFISSGWEGSATDARVLRSALLAGFRVPKGKYYLVDGGIYANTPSFLAPYRGVRYHLKGLDTDNIGRATTRNCSITAMLFYGTI
jgi:hypothetical protein